MVSEFLDYETRDHLAIDFAIGLFTAHSELGGVWKKEFAPALAGNRSEWEADRADIMRLQAELACSGADFRQKLCVAITTLRKADPLFQQLTNGSVLRTIDLLALKQWMWKGRELSSLFPNGSDLFSWWPKLDWDACLQVLNPGEEWNHAFAVDDAYDAELTELRVRRRELLAQVDALRREQSRELSAKYSRMPNREREYIWDRNDLRQLRQAATDPNLSLRGETSWEVVYQIKDRPLVTQLLHQLEQLSAQITDREMAVLHDISRRLSAHAALFRQVELAWGRLDWLLTRIVFAHKLGWTFPIHESGVWVIDDAVHPLLTATLSSKGMQPTPVSFNLQQGVSVLVGPNMGGKTVALKTAGLLQTLAQYGMPVPAGLFRFDFVSQIRYIGGDSQSMEDGLSSFGGEIVRIVLVVKHANCSKHDGSPPEQPAMILLDEVGRATNPLEGEALAVAVARYMQSASQVVFIASHYAGVAQLDGISKWQVAGFSDYRIVPAVDKSLKQEALNIAEQLGLPVEILELARDWLRREGRSHDEQTAPQSAAD